MQEKGSREYRWLFIAFLILGAGLRLALYWINPPANSFDDHFEPIKLIMNTGSIPGKYACWECYQPPVFYVTSAMVGKALLATGIATQSNLPKFLQFLTCFYGIATLGVVFLTLRLLPLSNFARLCALGLACFMPRLIYMSAMNSNDALSYLGVSVCIYLLIRVVEGGPSTGQLLLLSAAICVAIFTKYTAFIILPVVFFTIFSLAWRRLSFSTLVSRTVTVLAAPLVLLAAYCINNQINEGVALPFNTDLANPSETQPHDSSRYDFVTFKPWLFVNYPILRPGQLNSFWTVMYSGMWFDTEPKFIDNTGQLPWWLTYYGWMQGRGAFPEDATVAAPRGILLVGSWLEVLGLIPLLLGLTGVWVLLRGVLPRGAGQREYKPLLLAFLMLAILAVASAMQLYVEVPSYSAIKSSYILGAIPAFCALVGLGAQAWEKRRGGAIVCGAFLGALFLLTIVHVIQLAHFWNQFDSARLIGPVT